MADVLKRGRKIRAGFFASDKRSEGWYSRPGWCAASLVLERCQGGEPRSWNFKAVDLLHESTSVTFDGLRQVAATILGLTQEWQVQPKTLIVASASPVVAEVMADHLIFEQKITTIFPDLLFGWHPLATLIQMLIQEDAPTLFINLGRFPVVTFSLAWKT
jgi:hypothetical protein